MRTLHAGAVLRLGPAASPQFVTPILFRVTKPPVEAATCTDWVWLDGYELGPDGLAVERRAVFVQLAGVAVLHGAGT